MHRRPALRRYRAVCPSSAPHSSASGRWWVRGTSRCSAKAGTVAGAAVWISFLLAGGDRGAPRLRGGEARCSVSVERRRRRLPGRGVRTDASSGSPRGSSISWSVMCIVSPASARSTSMGCATARGATSTEAAPTRHAPRGHSRVPLLVLDAVRPPDATGPRPCPARAGRSSCGSATRSSRTRQDLAAERGRAPGLGRRARQRVFLPQSAVPPSDSAPSHTSVPEAAPETNAICER